MESLRTRINITDFNSLETSKMSLCYCSLTVGSNPTLSDALTTVLCVCAYTKLSPSYIVEIR